jgi:hypothetical protein
MGSAVAAMAKDGQDERFEPSSILPQSSRVCREIWQGASGCQMGTSRGELLYRVDPGTSGSAGSTSMNEVSLAEAFSRYNVEASSRARFALTADRALVLSCSYGRFQRAAAGVLKYEEGLSGDADQRLATRSGCA